jgi:hypothetical protein
MRREALYILDDAAALDGLHLRELPFGALRRAAPQMAFATFGTHEFARARQAKPLGGRLMGLELYFAFSFCFARHSYLLLSEKINRGV